MTHHLSPQRLSAILHLRHSLSGGSLFLLAELPALSLLPKVSKAPLLT